MERLPFEGDRPQLVRSIGVANFADQRVPAKARLDADLVALARMQANLDQARQCKFLDDRVMADRFCGARILRVCFLLDECPSVPDQMIAPCARVGRWMAVDHRQVDALGRALAKLVLECGVCPGILGEEHHA